MSNNKVNIDFSTLGITFVEGETYQVKIGEGFIKEVGNNFKKSPAVTSGNEFVASRATPTFVNYITPLNHISNLSDGVNYGFTITDNSITTGTAAPSVVITFDKYVYKGSGNVYITKNNTTTATISVSSSTFSTNENLATFNFASNNFQAGENYKVTWDSTAFKNKLNLPTTGTNAFINFTLPGPVSVGAITSTFNVIGTPEPIIGSQPAGTTYLQFGLSEQTVAPLITGGETGVFILKKFAPGNPEINRWYSHVEPFPLTTSTIYRTWYTVSTSTGIVTLPNLDAFNNLEPSTKYFVVTNDSPLRPKGYTNNLTGYFDVSSTSTIHFTSPPEIAPPALTSILPSYNSTNFTGTSVSFTLDRKITKGSGNFYLSKTTGSTSTGIVLSVSSSTVVNSTATSSLTLNFSASSIDPGTTYILTSDSQVIYSSDKIYTGTPNAYTGIVNTSTVKFTTISEPAPVLTSVIPTYNTSNFTGTSTVLLFDKHTGPGSGNVYITKQSSSSLSTQTVSVNSLTYSSTGSATLFLGTMTTSTVYTITTDPTAFVYPDRYYSPQYSGITTTSTVRFTTVPQLEVISYTIPSSTNSNTLIINFNNPVYRTGTSIGLELGSEGLAPGHNFTAAEESNSGTTITYNTSAISFVTGNNYAFFFSSTNVYHNGLTYVANRPSPPALYVAFTYS